MGEAEPEMETQGMGCRFAVRESPFQLSGRAVGRRECWNAWLVGEHSPLCLQMRQQHPTMVPRGGGGGQRL